RKELVDELHGLRQKVLEFRQLQDEHDSVLCRLEQKEAFNFALFNYSPVWTVVVDQEGRVVRSNRAKRQSGSRLPNIGDVMYRDYASHHTIDMYKEMRECIDSGEKRTFRELRYKNRFLTITIAPFPGGAIITSQDITDRKQAEHDRERLIEELRNALNEVETLRGFLPICAHCKKIRDDKGFWTNVEDYISSRSLVDFSHTYCPGCAKELYPEIYEKRLKKSMCSD
ncbi:MAG: PAS domain S-box protein, partial [Chitinivibrionales bacterium]|nr:PAS domain S-box protein [Chitinivibrionales bacterium]